MTTRRWRDPRDGRAWEVSVSRVSQLSGPGTRAPPASAPPPVRVSFDLLTTPRRAFATSCCERSERLVPRMEDQEMALCLEAARRGGRVWVDPRDGQLWWVQGYGRPERRGPAPGVALPVVFQSVRRTVGARSPEGRSVRELSDAELGTLLDTGDSL